MTKNEFIKWVRRDGKINTIKYGPVYIELYGINDGICRRNDLPVSKFAKIIHKLWCWLINDADWRVYYSLRKNHSKVLLGIKKHQDEDKINVGFAGPLYSFKTLSQNIQLLERFTNSWR